MATPTKDPITTHVLDQTTGHPAAGITILLQTQQQQQEDTSAHLTWSAQTDADGRVATWTVHSATPAQAPAAADVKPPQLSVLEAITSSSGPRTWRLVFQVGAYFKGIGKSAFWPQVELVFTVDPMDGKGHWHVPLLLGPYGYTTYRGS